MDDVTGYPDTVIDSSQPNKQSGMTSFYKPWDRKSRIPLAGLPLIWVLAFDLGLDYERDDDQYIKEAIQTIESRFDLVLITDRFEESVILLKGTDLIEVTGSNLTNIFFILKSVKSFGKSVSDMLCMKFDDITSLKLKVRRNGDRTSLDAKHEAAIRKWNKLVWFSNSIWLVQRFPILSLANCLKGIWKPFLDSALYDHFLTKLNDKIIKYGEEKMLEDLKTLQGKIECVSSIF